VIGYEDEGWIDLAQVNASNSCGSSNIVPSDSPTIYTISRPLQRSWRLRLHFLYHSYNKLTAWSRVLVDQLVVAQLVKKFPVFYGTRRFSTVFTRSPHRSIPLARWIQLTLSHHIYLFLIDFNIILSSTPRSSEWSLHFKYCNKNVIIFITL
jgi:hypothetical protein